MVDFLPKRTTRRAFANVVGGGFLASLLLARTGGVLLAQTPEATPLPAPPKPSCDDPPTPSDQEGPYFTPGSPERDSLLEPGMPGTVLHLSGYVFSTECKPIENAKLDFWQADANGVYDLEGFILRGHQFTDSDGLYRLETVVPGRYEPRPPHIHVRVEADGFPALVSQLYFDDGGSGGDPESRLLVPEPQPDESVKASFNFILESE